MDPNEIEVVAIYGDGMIVAVGSPNNDDNDIDSGHVKIYKWDDGLLNYKQLGETIDGEAAGDNFSEVSLSSNGKTLAFGGECNNANGSNSGHVKVFSFEDHDSSWKQVGQTIVGEASGDNFGDFVSLSTDGKTLAVSAPSNANGSDCVKIYMCDEGFLNYEQLGGSILGAAENYLGHSLSLSGKGKTVAIGAPWNDSNGEQSGLARVYRIDGKLYWWELGQGFFGENAGDYFGWSVALSKEGNALAISAALSNMGAGHVSIYGLDDDEQSWKELGLDIIGSGGEHLGNMSHSLQMARLWRLELSSMTIRVIMQVVQWSIGGMKLC
mmetsp:Transcript_2280/g.4349  ORF Transcript_2280/g.4349 Transcript_2280/m.4349 type:complete len:325 (+) Transcript_2280:88-1062(+)